MTPPFPPTITADGRFQLKRRLGEGGFGTVYEAFDAKRRTTVALKMLHRFDVAALHRFKQEFRTLADIHHPNLVSLYELFFEGDEWFFTMELIEGVSMLEHVLDRPNRSRPHLDRLRRALYQIADALCAIHQLSILHCDIKPSNVLVTPEGRAVLLDFGLATELTHVDRTLGSGLFGTPVFMSPEYGAGLPIAESSDWYSLGVILYEAMTGEPPFRGTPLEILSKKQTVEPRAPSALVPDVPHDLDQLCQELLRRDPAARPDGSEVLRRLARGISVTGGSIGASTRGRTKALIGRREHLAVLTEGYRSTEGGRPVLVTMHGRSGMGKTALVQQFLHDVCRAEPSTVVFSGKCYEQEAVPYKAIDAIVDQLARYLTRLSAAEAARLLPRDVSPLARLFPAFQQAEAIARAPARIPEAGDSQELRRRAFTALRDLLGALADQRPLILFIDDLQWADVDSGVLLTELLRPPDAPGMLLITCYRSEDRYTSPLLAGLLPALSTQATSAGVREIEVGELSLAELRELVRDRLAEKAVPERCVEEIVQESYGSPFFVEEIVRYVVDGGGVIRLDQVLQARIAQLPAEARQLLELVSVAGRPLDVGIAIAALSAHSNPQSTLHHLRARRMVRASGTSEVPALEAYHDRIREVVVAGLHRDVLRRHHARLAQACEAAGPCDGAVLARHHQGAGNLQAAALHAEHAASLAADALAFDRAAQLFALALDLGGSEGQELRQLRVRLGDALANAGRGQQAADAYLAAVPGASPDEATDLERKSAEQLMRVGNIDQGLSVMERVVDRVGLKLPKTARAALCSLLFHRAYLTIRGSGFHERNAADVPPEILRRIDTCWSASLGLHMVDTIRAADYQHRHLIFALRAGEPYRVARALAMQVGNISIPGGRRGLQRVETLKQKTMAISVRTGSAHAKGLTILNAGVAARLLGCYRESVGLIEEAVVILSEQCRGVAWELQGARLFMLEGLIWLGEWKELSRRLPDYVQAAHSLGDLYGMTYLGVRSLPLSRLGTDEPAAAREISRDAVSKWSVRGFHLVHMYDLFAQLYVDLYTGEALQGWQRMEEHQKQLRRSLLLHIQAIRIEFLELRARLALCAAQAGGHQRLRDAERDARRLQAEDIPWAEGLGTLIRAGVAAAKGTTDRAVELLIRAEEQLQASNLGMHVAVARRRRGEFMGGDEGRDLVLSADAWMADQGVTNPARLANLLTPGAWHAR